MTLSCPTWMVALLAVCCAYVTLGLSLYRYEDMLWLLQRPNGDKSTSCEITLPSLFIRSGIATIFATLSAIAASLATGILLHNVDITYEKFVLRFFRWAFRFSMVVAVAFAFTGAPSVFLLGTFSMNASFSRDFGGVPCVERN